MAGRDRVIRYEFDARGKFARLVRIGKISISFFFFLFIPRRWNIEFSSIAKIDLSK